MRITNLPDANRHIQGAQRREWLRQYSPQHLEQSKKIILQGLHDRAPAISRATLILGAGGCTEIPLAEIARGSDEVVLADLDSWAMIQAGNELPSVTIRKRIQALSCDISGDVSTKLSRIIQCQNWQPLIKEGSHALFDMAAQCLEQCPVPDPPSIGSLITGEFGLVISSLVVSQLFSYPLLDMLDHIQRIAPDSFVDGERHRRYQETAQNFRVRIIKSHLHLMRQMMEQDGLAVLLSDVRGFAFMVYGTNHDPRHRRVLPIVPRVFPELVHEVFEVVEEAHWEWITDLPTDERPGRGYEVTGYVLKA